MSPHRPAFRRFRRLAGQAPCVPVYRQLTGDSLTPVSAFRQIERAAPSFLFESVIGGEKVGRFSFLGHRAVPAASRPGAARSSVTDAGDAADATAVHARRPARRARERWSNATARSTLPGLPRFTGGAVGYAGYDTVRYVERLPNAPPDDRGLPDLVVRLLRPHGHLRPHQQDDPGRRPRPRRRRRRPRDAPTTGPARRVDELVERLRRARRRAAARPTSTPTARSRSSRKSNFTREAVRGGRRQCQEYIRAGDIFQVVLSQRFAGRDDGRPVRHLSHAAGREPQPVHVLPRTSDDFTLVGSSPEIMVRVEDGKVTIRPLAGTRRRGDDRGRRPARWPRNCWPTPRSGPSTSCSSTWAATTSAASPTIGTRAAHRRDDGRALQPRHAHHVERHRPARRRARRPSTPCAPACRPAPSRGAPKVRAMQIIDELEPHRRGPYAGAVGYVDFTGNMDTCIALRTLVVAGADGLRPGRRRHRRRQRPRRASTRRRSTRPAGCSRRSRSPRRSSERAWPRSPSPIRLSG